MTAHTNLTPRSVMDVAKEVRRMAAASFNVWRATNGLAQPRTVTGETLPDGSKRYEIVDPDAGFSPMLQIGMFMHMHGAIAARPVQS